MFGIWIFSYLQSLFGDFKAWLEPRLKGFLALFCGISARDFSNPLGFIDPTGPLLADCFEVKGFWPSRAGPDLAKCFLAPRRRFLAPLAGPFKGPFPALTGLLRLVGPSRDGTFGPEDFLSALLLTNSGPVFATKKGSNVE